jgi:hypothetical protein
VTHAQVSVNPDSMRIGWHTDWGTGFPFKDLGLPQNYESANPGVALFGFEYDESYRNSTGPELWRGLDSAEEQIKEAATHRRMTLTQYKKFLQKNYRETLAALHHRSALQEN